MGSECKNCSSTTNVKDVRIGLELISLCFDCRLSHFSPTIDKEGIVEVEKYFKGEPSHIDEHSKDIIDDNETIVFEVIRNWKSTKKRI